MRTYTLYEMVGMLRLGLWRGGAVDKLCYVGMGTRGENAVTNRGWRGVYLSADAMIEGCEVSESGAGCVISLSLYNPYARAYHIYTLEASVGGREWLMSKMIDIASGKRDDYVWSHNIYKSNIFSIERKYSANYTSIRSGSIGVPRKSRIFGR